MDNPPNAMALRFKIQRMVEFKDTDMAGIVHFSNFFVYMEQVEHAFLRSLDLGVVMEVEGSRISWPRVRAECNYRQSIRFEELIDIELYIQRIGNKSITYGFDFLKNQQVVADGLITAVCCILNSGKKPEPIPIPQVFIEALTPYRLWSAEENSGEHNT
jgi:acyl-CoA thioester hydrolase